MRFPSKELVERIRRQYPAGCRVELLQMDDAQAPPVGTCGTVTGVDDTGSLLMQWDTGSGLNVIYGEDAVRRICPECGQPLTGRPALSRKDNRTEICADCGTKQALAAFGVNDDDQEEIIAAIHQASDEIVSK